jgi:hypothetical protein
MNRTLVRGLIAGAVILAGMLLGSVARADELPFTAMGFIPGFTVSDQGHYTFDTSGTGDSIGDFTGSGEFDLNSIPGDITNGDSTFVDINGDVLMITFEGSVGVTGVFMETFAFVGGTGQWDGATGGGTITGQVNADGSATYAVDGVIDLP